MQKITKEKPIYNSWSKTNLAITIPIILSVIYIGMGVWLDTQLTLNQQILFTSFQFSSITAALFAGYWLWRRHTGWKFRLSIAFGVYILWRLSYFSILVFAGWFASITEWLLTQTTLLPVFIYPTFLLMMAWLQWAVIASAHVFIKTSKITVRVGFLILLAISTSVAFSSKADITFLPDDSWTLNRTLPNHSSPTANPFFQVVKDDRYEISEQLLILASGFMYESIPSSPWSNSVKGVLEKLFRNNPQTTTKIRLQEHYLAFRVAHKNISHD